VSCPIPVADAHFVVLASHVGPTDQTTDPHSIPSQRGHGLDEGVEPPSQSILGEVSGHEAQSSARSSDSPGQGRPRPQRCSGASSATSAVILAIASGPAPNNRASGEGSTAPSLMDVVTAAAAGSLAWSPCAAAPPRLSSGALGVEHTPPPTRATPRPAGQGAGQTLSDLCELFSAQVMTSVVSKAAR
jgi:hypothetical protein